MEHERAVHRKVPKWDVHLRLKEQVHLQAIIICCWRFLLVFAVCTHQKGFLLLQLQYCKLMWVYIEQVSPTFNGPSFCFRTEHNYSAQTCTRPRMRCQKLNNKKKHRHAVKQLPRNTAKKHSNTTTFEHFIQEDSSTLADSKAALPKKDAPGGRRGDLQVPVLSRLVLWTVVWMLRLQWG